MPLTLSITNVPAGQPGLSPTLVLNENGGSIGRKADNDWTLPDEERFISGKHALVRFMDGSYYLDDLSANGTFLNDSQQPIGRGNAVRLSDGDRLYVGDYEIQVAITAAVAPDPFADDPFAAPQSADPTGGVDPYNMPPNAPEPALPDDYSQPAAPDPYQMPQRGAAPDLLAGGAGTPVDPLENFDAPGGNFDLPADSGWESQGASIADHSPGISDAFVAPSADAQQIPDDFDPMKTSFPTPPPAPQAPPAYDPGQQAPPPQPAAPMQPVHQTQPVGHGIQQPTHQIPVQQMPPPGPGDQDALRVLLDGAGLNAGHVPPGGAHALMHVAGQIFREVVGGMMEVLRARAELKSEFRMQLTTIAPQENNPLKFSVGVDDALEALLFNETRGYLPPVQAVQEGFNDIRAHQMAMMAGMRAAFQSVLGQFDPDKLSARFDRDSKRGGLLGIGGKGRYWDSYQELYEEMTRDPDQCFRSLFGDEFSRAYEEQMARLSGGKL